MNLYNQYGKNCTRPQLYAYNMKNSRNLSWDLAPAWSFTDGLARNETPVNRYIVESWRSQVEDTLGTFAVSATTQCARDKNRTVKSKTFNCMYFTMIYFLRWSEQRMIWKRFCTYFEEDWSSNHTIAKTQIISDRNPLFSYPSRFWWWCHDEAIWR